MITSKIVFVTFPRSKAGDFIRFKRTHDVISWGYNETEYFAEVKIEIG